MMKKCQQWYVPSEYRSENPDLIPSGLRSVGRQGENRSTTTAHTVRDKFLEYFNTSGVVHWQYDAVDNGDY